MHPQCAALSTQVKRFSFTSCYLCLMNLSNPATVLLSDSDARVLKVLAGTTTPLTGRAIARLCGGVQSTTQRSLNRLAEHGLLHSQEIGAGAAVLYRLNSEHL